MPVSEVHQRYGNEAAACNDLITEHLCLTEAQVGAGKSCQSSADGQSLEAHPVDLDAYRVGSPGIGAYSSDPQSPGSLEEYVPSDKNKEECKVDEHIVTEENRAQDGDFRKSGNREVVDAGNRLGSSDEVTEQGTGSTDAEHLQPYSGNALRSAEGDDDKPEEHAEEGSHSHSQSKAENVVDARGGTALSDAVGNEHTQEGSHGHNPFTTEIEHSGTLVEHLPKGGDKQGDGEGYAQA